MCECVSTPSAYGWLITHSTVSGSQSWTGSKQRKEFTLPHECSYLSTDNVPIVQRSGRNLGEWSQITVTAKRKHIERDNEWKKQRELPFSSPPPPNKVLAKMKMWALHTSRPSGVFILLGKTETGGRGGRKGLCQQIVGHKLVNKICPVLSLKQPILYISLSSWFICFSAYSRLYFGSISQYMSFRLYKSLFINDLPSVEKITVGGGVYNLLLLIGNLKINCRFQSIILVIPIKHVCCYLPKYIYFYHQLKFYCCFQELFRAYAVLVNCFYLQVLVHPVLVLSPRVTINDKTTLYVSMYISIYIIYMHMYVPIWKFLCIKEGKL